MLRIDETSLIIALLKEITLTAFSVESWKNDRSMSKQHIAILLGATCCARLATMLRFVATCWVLLAQVSLSSNLS